MAHDIFISYRRNGGFETAYYLYEHLVRDGYGVTFDIDTLRSGRFDEVLLSRIDECTDFIVILSPGCFDRTVDPAFPKENDWLRRELAHALANGKNVVPVILRDFAGFPSNLPEDVEEVKWMNGPEYSHQYIGDFYERLKQRFLRSKPARPGTAPVAAPPPADPLAAEGIPALGKPVPELERTGLSDDASCDPTAAHGAKGRGAKSPAGKLKPYNGSKPYAFVSYSHLDRETVEPYLVQLQALGYRLWFDNGITPSSIWNNVLADKIKKSCLLILFGSKHSYASQQVYKEVAFADAQGKPRLPLRLDRTEIPGGLSFQLSLYQWVDLFDYGTVEAAVACITASEHLGRCKDNAKAHSNDKPTPPSALGADVPAPPLPPVMDIPPTASSTAADRSARQPGELKSVKIADGVFMTFCWCPATTSTEWKAISGGDEWFWMGSPEGEKGREPTETRHSVRLTKGFWIGQTPVARSQWSSLMPSRGQSDERALWGVTWEEAREFASKVSQRTNCTCRLPTEAKWEYACRAGTTGPFAGTGKPNQMGYLPSLAQQVTMVITLIVPYVNLVALTVSCIMLVAKLLGSKWICNPAIDPFPIPVGRFAPNAWNICDMHGNVAEWCLDWFGAYPTTLQTDPAGLPSGELKVVRGRRSSVNTAVKFSRSASRSAFSPSKRYPCGVRLVMEDEA